MIVHSAPIYICMGCGAIYNATEASVLILTRSPCLKCGDKPVEFMKGIRVERQ